MIQKCDSITEISLLLSKLFVTSLLIQMILFELMHYQKYSAEVKAKRMQKEFVVVAKLIEILKF